MIINIKEVIWYVIVIAIFALNQSLIVPNIMVISSEVSLVLYFHLFDCSFNPPLFLHINPNSLSPL